MRLCSYLVILYDISKYTNNTNKLQLHNTNKHVISMYIYNIGVVKVNVGVQKLLKLLSGYQIKGKAALYLPAHHITCY